MTQPIYAIGDIHGDLNQLHRILAWIDADIDSNGIKDHKVVFIGDLVDRREDSKGVIDLILQQINAGAPWIVLKGNHDRMFSMFLEQNGAQDPILRKDLTWIHSRLGGATTLASYGIAAGPDIDPKQTHTDALKAVPQSHRDFLRNLPTHYQTDDLFFAHAGINPDRSLDDQIEDDLIWIRTPFHIHTGDYEKLIIHGHTPVDLVTHYGNRINIDTGCAFGNALSAIVLEGRTSWEIGPSERIPLRQG